MVPSLCDSKSDLKIHKTSLCDRFKVRFKNIQNKGVECCTWPKIKKKKANKKLLEQDTVPKEKNIYTQHKKKAFIKELNVKQNVKYTCKQNPHVSINR